MSTKNLNFDGVEKLSDLERGYVTGFIDGEGTITLSLKKRNSLHRLPFHFHPELAIVGTDTRSMEWMKKRFGNSGCLIPNSTAKKLQEPEYANQKMGYRLIFSGNLMRWLLPQLKDCLMLKQRQCDLLLDYLKLTKCVKGNKKTQQGFQDKTELAIGFYPRYIEIYKEIRRLNRRGRINKQGEFGENLRQLELWLSCYGNAEPSLWVDLIKSLREGVTVRPDAIDPAIMVTSALPVVG